MPSSTPSPSATTDPGAPLPARRARAARPRRAAAALVAGALLAVAAAGSAQADDIYNTLPDNVDAGLEVVPLEVGGPAAEVGMSVLPIRADGVPGCNLTPGTQYVVEVRSTRPEVASVSPSRLTFTSCADRPTVTVTPHAAGLTTVRLWDVPNGNTTGGTFRLGAAAFSVPVTLPRPNTPPTVTVGGVQDQGVYPVGAVPEPTCDVDDEQDADPVPVLTTGPVTGPNAADGIGSQDVTCTYTDAGGLPGSDSVTYAVVDPTPAVAEGTVLDEPDGLEGWYTGDVRVAWELADPESPGSVRALEGCTDDPITEDGTAASATCTATSAGGDSPQQVLTVPRDATAPTVVRTQVSGTRSEESGWYTSPVTVTYEAQDATSGPATQRDAVTSTGEGPAVEVSSPAFVDVAGNTTPAGAVTETFAIDLADPVPTFDRTLTRSAFGKLPAAPTCTAVDQGSGPASCVVTGYRTTVGTHTLTATATDHAGRTATATQTYSVHKWVARGFRDPVEMRGVVNVVKAGRTVPVGFELFAGHTEIRTTSAVTMSSTRISCPRGKSDTLDDTTSGATSLTYDKRAGRFLYRWKTPTAPGTCHRLTMTAADGTTLSALFRLK